MVFVYKGPIMGKPRATRSDKWNKRPCIVRYREMADHMRLQAREQSFTPCAAIKATVGIQMPKSWSIKKKKEFLGTPHQQKPDVDNITKAIMDILCKDDAFIYHIDIKKFWAEKNIILIENIEHGNETRVDFGHYFSS